MCINLSSPIETLSGVGEKRAKYYRKLGIDNVETLLGHFPREYIDLTSPTLISELQVGETSVIKAKITRKHQGFVTSRGLSIYKIQAEDSSSSINITFFNMKYTVDHLQVGEEYLFYGKIIGTLLEKELNSPTVYSLTIPSKLIPKYSLTKGLTHGIIYANVKNTMPHVIKKFKEPIPKKIRDDFSLCSKSFAIKNIHIPNDKDALEKAKNRLIFEELFIILCAFNQIKRRNKEKTSFQIKETCIDDYLNSLPFELTNAQKRSLDDCICDMSKPTSMNRIIQGDVGSGKTAVSVGAMYVAYKNGYQSTMMAPTEILATQHFHSINSLLAPLGVTVELLTGSMTAKQKREVKKRLTDGEINILVGTHAIISKDVEFNNLALVITDEQHRFGVSQRAKLSQKSINPHVLVMSATPIPRTLSLIVYGDLDISVIDEIPLGRLPIDTYLIRGNKRHRAFDFIKKQLDLGLQAYIVCPLIEANEENANLKSVDEYAQNISQEIFNDYSVGILHGKMKSKEKDQVMKDFKDGKISLLVSTTVIEVGIDVPNAVIMLIEDADRFGLSQLHQLRGRVGRGDVQSYCILVSQTKSSDTIHRLKSFCKTTNGFEIAKEDLKIRGAGDILGERQHGLPEMKIADMTEDLSILEQAKKAVSYLNDGKIKLTHEEYLPLRQHINVLLGKVGEKLN